MERIIMINGNVSFKITLDPTVWILDDRKVDLTTHFSSPTKKVEDNYVKEMASFWDKELEASNSNKPVLKTEKERLTTGSYGMPLHYFLHLATPNENATSLEIITTTDAYLLPLDEAANIVLGFSKDGKALQEDGPVHAHLSNGQVITHLRSLTVK